jgi:hypothetical protein
MATLMTITTTTNTVALREGRRGEASFTVFNASGRPLRARPQLVPGPSGLGQDPSAGGWLSVAGEAERDFAIAEAHQYTVRIEVPPDAPPGGYPFRLDMVGVENPDEQYTQGPTVIFHVQQPAPKKAFPWWILATAAGVVLIIGIILAIILWPRSVIVPAVRNETLADASAIITNAQLTVAEDIQEEASDEIGEGFVVGTRPPEAEEVPRGSEITLIVSTGPALVAIPELAGETLSEAESALTAVGLPVGETEREPHEVLDRDRIISSDPSAGAMVSPGSAVDLVVSGGRATVRHLFSPEGDGLGPDLVESWLGSINALFWRLELTQEPVELVDGRPWNATTVQETLDANRDALPHYSESEVIDDYGLRVFATFPGAVQLLDQLAEIEFHVYE